MSSTTSDAPSTSAPGLAVVTDYTEGVNHLDYMLIASSLLGIAAIGTLFNGIAIAVFIRYRDLRSPTNSFVIALCVCDFFMSVIGAPIPAYYSLLESYIKSDLLCSLDAFTVYFLSCTSIYLLTAISVDRYFIIVKPIASMVITQRTANLSIFMCFAVGGLWATMPLVGWNGYSLEGIGVACSVTWSSEEPLYRSFIVMLFLACFMAPLLAMGFCYASIILTVRKIFRGTFMKKFRKHYLIECRMIKTVIVMIAFFIVSWMPYAVVSFSLAFGSRMEMSRLVETIPALIAKSSCIWNPIVYVAMNSHFRSGFCSLLPFGKKLLLQNGDNSSKDEYDLANNEFSHGARDEEAKAMNGVAAAPAKPGGGGDRKNAPGKLSLSTVTTSLYASNACKKSSMTSFISTDCERSSNRCLSENASAYSLVVSDQDLSANSFVESERRASDSVAVAGGYVYESSLKVQDSHKPAKRSILKKLRRSKLRVGESSTPAAAESIFVTSRGADSGCQRSVSLSDSLHRGGARVNPTAEDGGHSRGGSEPHLRTTRIVVERLSQLKAFKKPGSRKSGHGGGIASDILRATSLRSKMVRSLSQPEDGKPLRTCTKRSSVPEFDKFLENDSSFC